MKRKEKHTKTFELMIDTSTSFSKVYLVRLFASVCIALLPFYGTSQEYFNVATSSGGNSIPLSWTSAGAKGEQLWPAGDFGAVPSGKQISRIYYFTHSSGNGSAPYDHLRISMKQENVANLSSGSWTTGITEVFFSSNYTINNINGQWFSIDLDNPFPFNPNLPLIVQIESHMSTFDSWFCGVAPGAAGAWRAFAQPYTAANPTSNGSYRMMFGFDMIDGASLPYCQNFEGGDGGFESGGTLNSWEFGEPTNTIIDSAYSGDSAWVTNLDGDHNNSELSFVRSPAFDMTELNDPMLKFWCNYDLQNGTDGVAVEVSGDSGATWATLGSTLSTGPWYNSSTVSALSTSLGNGNGWTGQSNGWEPMEHSLSSYVNDTAVLIRWRLASNGSVTNEGYGLDDVIVAESNDVALVELTYPDSICGTSTTTITAEFCNRSYEPKHGFGIDLDTNGVTVNYSYPDTLDVCECDTVDILVFNTTMGGTWTLEARVDNVGDVNLSNDTLLGQLTTFATPTAHISGGGNYCTDEQGELTIELTGTAPWDVTFTNGTTLTTLTGDTVSPIVVQTSLSGTFTISFVGDSAGCPADTANISGSAVISYLPILPVNLGSNRELCSGELLDAGSYQSYDWNFGNTTQTIEVFTTGNYAVTVTDSLGCTDTDTVNITMLVRPIITISDTVICEGSSFTFNAGSGAQSYLWHDGSTAQVFTLSDTGTVSVTVTGSNGCESMASATIDEVVPNPEPIVTSTSGPAPVTLDAGAGYIGYLWSTNQSTQTIDVYQEGTYTCTVTNANGCRGEDDVEALIEVAGISNINGNDEGIRLWPNPTADYIQIETTEALLEISGFEILDLKGSVVRSGVLPNDNDEPVIIDVSELEGSSYLIRLYTSDGVSRQALFTKL